MKKIHYYAQLQQTECGLCCVKMLLDYYGCVISMTKLRNEVNVGRDGTSIQVLRDLLCNYHMEASIRKATTKDVLELKVPAILFWEGKHYVVFERTAGKHVVIVDPALGRKKISFDEFQKNYSGYIIQAEKDEDFKTVSERFTSWKLFLPEILKNKKQYVIVMVLSIFSYMITILSTKLLQAIVDNVMLQSKYWFFVKSFAAVAVITGVVMYLNNMALIRLRMGIDRNLTSKVIKDLLAADYQFFDTRSKGELVFSLNSCSTVRELFAEQAVKGIVQVGAAFAITLYFFLQSRAIGIVVFILLIINFIYTAITYPIAIDLSKGYIGEQGRLQSTYIEMVQSIMAIKMISYEKSIFNRWKEQFEVFQSKYFTSEKMSNIVDVIGTTLQTVSPLIVLMMGINFTLAGEMSIGTTMALYFLSNSYFSFVKTIFTTYLCLVRANIYIERLGDISSQNEKEMDESTLKQYCATGEINLESVSYSYGGASQEVLSDITMNIHAGEKIAVVGKSGCGKSTLAKLLIGLYKPTKGRITYDSFDASSLDMGHIRKQFGIVSQEAVLFNKSIYENISVNRDGLTLEDVKEVTKIVNIYDEIMDMPMKFNTLISDGGMNLSGGQRQRIILARALMNHPKVLVLDEATSALDNINEAKLSDYLKTQGCTRIIIAHRLSTIIDADKIFVLDKGRIVEKGTHRALLESEGIYHQLYSTQAGEQREGRMN